jgi:hypothetical protein
LDFQIQFRITLTESTAYGGLGFAQREKEKSQNYSVPLRSPAGSGGLRGNFVSNAFPA